MDYNKIYSTRLLKYVPTLTKINYIYLHFQLEYDKIYRKNKIIIYRLNHNF